MSDRRPAHVVVPLLPPPAARLRQVAVVPHEREEECVVHQTPVTPSGQVDGETAERGGGVMDE